MSKGAEAEREIARSLFGADAISSLHGVVAASSSLAWAEAHPLAEHLRTALPGTTLAAELVVTEVADADDAALVEGVAAWERVMSWATAQQARWVAELARRPRPGEDVTGKFVADEVASALGVSRRSAENKVCFGLSLADAPTVHDALARGAVDVRKADVILRETAHLAPADAHAVYAAVLPGAGERTVPQLRAAVRRAEVTLDVGALARRHERSARERSVVMTPCRDAMAYVTAYLPADGAVAVMTALDAMAAACAPEDARPLDARRADALVDMATDVLGSGIGPRGVPLPTQQRRRPHLAVSITPAALLGLASTPAHLAGYGDIPAGMARRIAADAAWQGILTDLGRGAATTATATGAMVSRRYVPSDALVAHVVARDVTCTFPGCRIPATRCDVDHIDPFDHTDRRAAQTRVDNLQALCRHHHRLKTHGGWTPRRDASTGVTTWRSRTGQVYTRDPVLLPEEMWHAQGARQGGAATRTDLAMGNRAGAPGRGVGPPFSPEPTASPPEREREPEPPF